MNKKNPVILIIDDDQEFTESNKDLLEAHGYQVFTSNKGRDGYNLASRIIPDVIILDVMMATETEGFEIARKISENPALAEVSILLVTGMGKEMNLSSPVSPDQTWLPVDRILDKPVQPARLICEIKRLLNKS